LQSVDLLLEEDLQQLSHLAGKMENSKYVDDFIQYARALDMMNQSITTVNKDPGPTTKPA
jgi:hypothetical protein